MQSPTPTTEKKGMTFEQEKELRWIQHQYDCFRQTNQAAIDSGTKAMNGLFLLNGAATTALLTQSHLGLKYAAIIFAIAALLSIIGLGITHISNLILSDTWRLEEPEKSCDPWIPIPPFAKVLSRDEIDRYRVWIVAFCTLPGVIFLIGLIVAGIAISSATGA